MAIAGNISLDFQLEEIKFIDGLESVIVAD